MVLIAPFPGLIAPLLVFHEGNNHRIGHPFVFAPTSSSSVSKGVATPWHGGGATTTAKADDIPPLRYDVWDLPNGRVQFDRPFYFDDLMMRRGTEILGVDDPPPSAAASSIALWDPIFLGSGGSGAVFSFSSTRPSSDVSSPSKSKGRTTNNGADGRIAIKVSWKRSNESVKKECDILRALAGVPHLERCIGGPIEYPYEDGRAIIALSPVMAASNNPHEDVITSDLNMVNPGIPQRKSAISVVKTMVKMLELGVYTIDVQPLINRETGEVLFIDFTEAKRISTPLSPVDESSLVDFCGEMLALIPNSLKGLAVEALKTEMIGLKNENTADLPGKVIDIIESVWLE
ncbi:hypothetical protein ACHAXA_008743 [Cyclostephanos tholiformis]|uniref:Protein kinase domain-containing protein n=1 Tax=Cyclostephanos tholiformis TaxID=382380 RepID=A0ABD3RBQ6_9STRA